MIAWREEAVTHTTTAAFRLARARRAWAAANWVFPTPPIPESTPDPPLWWVLPVRTAVCPAAKAVSSLRETSRSWKQSAVSGSTPTNTGSSWSTAR